MRRPPTHSEILGSCGGECLETSEASSWSGRWLVDCLRVFRPVPGNAWWRRLHGVGVRLLLSVAVAS